ncbi:nuclear transport factor 2 family protein [Glaciihabitans sp. dw_435]|uniref:nuclear transport factor 2 family protein n=1 Tax=Glaciihabitans sp. dw_435 TaxID=2720081 RepID=UPI001BD509CA|nr:nuclear transport factor 2 family protein [Glaciihabitans sp. dw_435]
MLSSDDRYEISETLALHAHISDENHLDRLEELFTPDAVYDMSASGMGAFTGMDAIHAAAAGLAQSGHAPLAHFVTNIVVTGRGDNEADALSKGLMIMADGSPHAVTYADTLRRHDGHWRISHRIITPARAPRPADAS